MKGVFLLLCLVLIQLSCTGADQQNYGSEVSGVLDRNIREAKKDAKKKSKPKGRKNRKNKGRKNSKGRTNSKIRKIRKGRKNSKGKKNIKNKNSMNSKRRKNSKGRKSSKTKKTSKGRKNSRGKKNIKESKNSERKGRKLNKIKKDKKKGRKNSKGRKNIKSKGKKGIKSKGKKNNTSNKKRMKGKEIVVDKPEARQTGQECFEKLNDRTKKFKKYQTQWRLAKRIETFVGKMEGKREKTSSTFQSASSSIMNATLNGTQCNGGNITEALRTANYALQNCKTTANDLCDSSKIEGLNTALTAECITKLKTALDDFNVCQFGNGSCPCYFALPDVEDSCINFDDLNDRTKDAKDKCIKNNEVGSFGYCRKQQRVVADEGVLCKYCPPTQTTTKAPVGRNQFSANRILQRLREKM